MCFRFQSVPSGFFNNRGPQLQQHVDRLLKDNFAPDPDLLCYTVVKTLYVKGEIYLGLLHCLLGKLFHQTSSFFLGIAAQPVWAMLKFHWLLPKS
jgi:hypothetical protein